MNRESLRKEYLQIVASVREYVEKQLELGFTELQETEQQSPYTTLELPQLDTHAQSCNRCPLHESRNSVVFGAGSTSATLMFVGEAPGADEDRQGEPFVGRAGQLLNRIIEAMKLTRDDVYIANILKCRPPRNRNPKPDEIRKCSPYLERQIELIRPQVIVALGGFAAKFLINTTAGISTLRGQFHPYLKVGRQENAPKIMPTYHPAYLLRNPNAKRDVWEDMKKVTAFLEK